MNLLPKRQPNNAPDRHDDVPWFKLRRLALRPNVFIVIRPNQFQTFAQRAQLLQAVQRNFHLVTPIPPLAPGTLRSKKVTIFVT
jgi:hypothetical protein